jgi:hypothetical protein
VGGNLLTVILELGQQGGLDGSFTEVEHNIYFLSVWPSGRFIYSVQTSGLESE